MPAKSQEDDDLYNGMSNPIYGRERWPNGLGVYDLASEETNNNNVHPVTQSKQNRAVPQLCQHLVLVSPKSESAKAKNYTAKFYGQHKARTD